MGDITISSKIGMLFMPCRYYHDEYYLSKRGCTTTCKRSRNKAGDEYGGSSFVQPRSFFFFSSSQTPSCRVIKQEIQLRFGTIIAVEGEVQGEKSQIINMAHHIFPKRSIFTSRCTFVSALRSYPV